MENFIHPWRDLYNAEHDMYVGPCACGGWHDGEGSFRNMLGKALPGNIVDASAYIGQQIIDKDLGRQIMEIKDSGKRQQFDSGMQRDVADDKVDYTLALDGPMFERYARHLTEGAKKYEKRNWLKAAGESELARFRESALRHFMQWYRGDQDEDHAAAVYFNINGAEYVRDGQERGYHPETVYRTGPDVVIQTVAEESGLQERYNEAAKTLAAIKGMAGHEDAWSIIQLIDGFERFVASRDVPVEEAEDDLPF